MSANSDTELVKEFQNQGVPLRMSVMEAAYLLAWQDLWDSLPTLGQLALYWRQDGAYGCAIAECEIVGSPQRGKDLMVNIGPVVFCHGHGKEVLAKLLGELGVSRQCQWSYLSKTCYFADQTDERAAAQAAEDGQVNRRAARASEEIKTRAARLEQARQEGPGYVERLAEEQRRGDGPLADRLRGVQPVASRPATPKPAASAPSAALAAAPAVELVPEHLPEPALVDPIDAMELSTVKDRLDKLDGVRDVLGNAEYARQKHKLLARQRKLEDAELTQLLGGEAPTGKAGEAAVVKPAAAPAAAQSTRAKILQLVPPDSKPDPYAVTVSILRAACDPRSAADLLVRTKVELDGTVTGVYCTVASNSHACKCVAPASDMAVLVTRLLSGQYKYFPFCRACKAIGAGAGIHFLENKTYAQILADEERRHRNGGERRSPPPQAAVREPKQMRDGCIGSMRHTGKTARTRTKRMGKAAEREAAAQAAAVARAAASAGRPSKEERKAARNRQ